MKEIWNSLDTTVQVAVVTGLFAVIVAIIGLFKFEKKKGEKPTKTVVKQIIKGDADNVSMTAIQNNYGVKPEETKREKKDKKNDGK